MYAVYGLTDVGSVRNQNQDAIFYCNEKVGPFPNLFAVADGMGGHKAGEVASHLALAEFTTHIQNFRAKDFIPKENFLDVFIEAAQVASAKVLEQAASDENMQGMGTTLSACTITPDTIYTVHIGDSRIYVITPQSIKQITKDHTYVNELVKTKHITAEEARTHPRRHVLTKVLGTQEHLDADCDIFAVGGTTAVLLCSDGLTNMVDDETIRKIATGGGYVADRTKRLIDEANKNGGQDNISVVLVNI